MLAIYKRELRSFFHGMMGYLLTAFLLAASGIYFLALNLGYGLTDFGYYTLYRTIFMLLLYFPVLAMRSLAEERRALTDQLLLTSPVSVWGIVVGKYLALCTVFTLPCLADGIMIAVLWLLGGTASGLRGEFRRAAVLFPAGLCGHRRLRVLLRPHGEPDHCGSHGLFGPAAGLYDAQPPQYVQRRKRRGTGGLYGSVGGSLPCGGPAHPELHAGLLLLCGPLRRAERPVPAAQRMAHRGVQRCLERPLPVCAL